MTPTPPAFGAVLSLQSYRHDPRGCRHNRSVTRLCGCVHQTRHARGHPVGMYDGPFSILSRFRHGSYDAGAYWDPSQTASPWASVNAYDRSNEAGLWFITGESTARGDRAAESHRGGCAGGVPRRVWRLVGVSAGGRQRDEFGRSNTRSNGDRSEYGDVG